MTRSHSTPYRPTADRVEKIRKLVTALQERSLTSGEIGTLLEVSASSVRNYLAVLQGKHTHALDAGRPVFTWILGEDATSAYLAILAATPLRKAAPPRSPLARAKCDPSRHFHILGDDEHIAIRVSRAAPARDWAVAALFGAGPASAGAHA